MSLQVWLPLNGDLHNQGLSSLTATNNGATVNNSGKIGKCYQFGTAASDISLPAAAMTSYTTECSVCFWLNILTWNTSYATFFQAGPASSPWTSYIFGLLRNNTASTCCFTISNGSSASNASYLTPAFNLNQWYHIALVYKTGHCLIYINGQLHQDYTTSIVPNFSGITTIKLGRCTNGSSYQTNCLMNDFRIYNHALSPKEVEEIAKGLVLHYKLDGETQIMVPPGYQQLEYLESSGTQYIDTGLKGNLNTSVQIKAKINNTSTNQNLFGSRTSATSNNIAFANSATAMTADFGNYTTTRLQAAINTTDIFEVYNSASKRYVNSTIATTQYTTAFTTPSNLYLFDCYQGFGTSKWNGRVYYCKIWNGTTLSRYFLPVKRLSDNTLGMYDVITNTFFANAGTGTFIAGPNTSITGTIYDSSGYSNDGTITGSLTAAAGSPRYEIATQFPGNTFIEAEPLPATTLTISAWVNFTDTSGSAYRMVLHDKNSGLAIGYYSSSIITYVGSAAGGTGSKVIANLTANTWYHIVVVKTGDTTRDTYINGEKATVTSNNWWGGDLTKFNIGCRHVSGSYSAYITGKIVDVRAYATALTVDQIKELYNTSMSIDSNGNVYARELNEL